MPRTVPLNEEMQKRARELYVPYAFGYKQVAKALGISPGSVRRYVVPGHRERDLRYSLEAKRKRTGVCERCGGETRYNGRTTSGASRICSSCAHTFTHCERGHKYTPETDLRGQEGYQRSGGWSCRICRNDYMRSYQQRRYAEDPEFRERKRLSNQRQYLKRKARSGEAP